MNRTPLILGGSLIVAAALVAALASGPRRPGRGPEAAATPATSAGPPPVVLCAAANRAVMEEIKADYERECGRTVELQYGSSQGLCAGLEVSGVGDLYLPSDDGFLDAARGRGLIAETLPLAEMRAVVAVVKGNPKGIVSFADLVRDDVRLVQASPGATAIGTVTRDTLAARGRWEELDRATAGYRTTITEAAQDLLVGAADAAIVYDAFLHPYPQLEAVPLPELAGAVSQLGLGVVAATPRPAAALHFARYVAASDRGLAHYRRHGFTVAAGDPWADRPALTIFAGSMLRPAIEATIEAFEAREGIDVSRVYNGCGILVAQMRSGQHPDAYFACDTEFMRALPELFPAPETISRNELAILVPKGNPRGVATLADLARAELRVGVGHEQQCAMGWLTHNTLRTAGVLDEVMANVAVQTPSGDMLVNQLRAGGLDAAVAYLSNAAAAAGEIDTIRIEGVADAVASQPFAVAVDSRHKQAAARLRDRITSAASRELFVASGFRWLADDPPAGTEPGDPADAR